MARRSRKPADSEKPPRIRDVAARAGVGVGTVSRVLNNSPSVAAPTRQRVLRAIEELGFRPSSAARRLSLGRTQTIGVVAPFFTQSSVVERVRGIDDVIGASSNDLTIFNVETAEQRARAFERFARSDRLDGLLVISLPPSPTEVAELDRDGLPVVLIDIDHERLPHVAIDDIAGGRLAVRHLVAAGHRKIGFVGFPEDGGLGMLSGAQRLRGMRAELDSAGVELSADFVRRGALGRATARRLTEELLALADPPTAIFAESDAQAFGVLSAAEDAGISVPEELSVMGFDDIELSAVIGLTTVRQHLRASGRRAARMLLDELEPSDVPTPLDPLPELEVIARRTVGPPGG